MFMQEALQPKLHHEATQPFGRCRCDARLDFTEGKRRDCFFIVCCRLCLFERDEPLLKQSDELLIHVLSFRVWVSWRIKEAPREIGSRGSETRSLFNARRPLPMAIIEGVWEEEETLHHELPLTTKSLSREDER